ncbi:hypothetical protein [Arthrobacter glacialis]|uniref:hypothetical protein n=1 Tax=Arthrobacter glacialis TaxID=1664 RepID=UPI000CD48619|nr:hypothetical protein [Arthrobacter glacialis]POH61164.1 hypothetical protein CVS28_01305 [Arthrobacter glacialis]
MQTTKRLPISTTNIALVSTFVAGAIATALTQNWSFAVLLLTVGLCGLGAALYARRPNSRDITRLNAIEYRDERDRELAKQGFATVGAAALILTVFEVVLALVFFNALVALISCAQMFALCIIWGTANSNAVKRR